MAAWGLRNDSDNFTPPVHRLGEQRRKRQGRAGVPVGQMALFLMVLVLFFLWGMSNNLTDILVQHFRKSFELTKFKAQLVST
jgi:FHS family L-fucose permease-like MFS transporter